MKDIPLLFICVMFAVLGYLAGYNEASKKPTEELVLSAISEEVANLQKDVIIWQETAMLLLVRMTFMEEWRASVLYRPPELLEEEENGDNQTVSKFFLKNWIRYLCHLILARNVVTQSSHYLPLD